MELFDEFEGLHAKCAHYIILAASKGTCSLELLTDSRKPIDKDSLPTDKELMKCKPWEVDWELKDSIIGAINSQVHSIRRYGQASCETPDGRLWMSGGFGVSEKGEHKRLNDLIVIHSNGINHRRFELLPRQFNARMYHSMDSLVDGTLVIFGGRSHPGNSFGDLILYTHQPDDDIGSTCYKEDCGISPLGRYRHASTVVEPSTVFICGGLHKPGYLQKDCWKLDLCEWVADKSKSPKWTEFASLPSGRHSASLSHWRNRLIIFGGLDEWEQVCNPSALVADSTLAEQSEWKEVKWNGPTPLPRYSHQSLVTQDGRLLLVGGASSCSPYSPGICVIRLCIDEWTCSEYTLPVTFNLNGLFALKIIIVLSNIYRAKMLKDP